MEAKALLSIMCVSPDILFEMVIMGTNYPNFILEANRVVKLGGKLFVAEVLSRFKDINGFVKLMKEEGGFK